MKHSTHSSTRTRNAAEGSPDRYEEREPRNPLKTSTMPAIRISSLDDNHSETGIIPIVNLSTEGKEDSDSQDASLTKDETRLPETNTPEADDQTAPEEDAETTVPVVIVEDTVELAEVIQATLESMGIEAIYATHGKTGLERIKELNPDLVVMDIGLPDITGWKMLDAIKEHYEGNGKDMPTIIVITAYGDPANRLIGKLQKIHSYLLKPFTPDQVEKIVGMAMRGEKPEPPVLGNDESSPIA